MDRPILVTGGTGTVGREVVRLLAERGVDVRVGTRRPDAPGDPAAGPAGGPPGVTRVRFDFHDPSTFGAALRGVGKLFLLWPPQLAGARREIRPCVAAARRAGVEHVVFLSVLGAERNPLLPHYRIERLLRASGMAYTLLRASYFMQNLTSVHREEIRQRGELFVPAGRGRTSFVDARDVAAAGAVALTEPGHLNRAYALTGPAAVDFYHVARLLTEVLSRPVFYRAPSTARYAYTLLRRGLPLRRVAVSAAIYTYIRAGLAATVGGDTAGVLRRPPVTLRRFVEAHRHRWD